MINGTEHRYAQWEWDICPKKAGVQVIPAYALDYTTQTTRPLFFPSFRAVKPNELIQTP